MNKTDIIERLNLSEHREGGYFRRTYESDMKISIADNASRHLMTSIFYLLTDDRPVGHFHRNKSDVIHYFQAGSPITYLTISPQGEFKKVVMGSDINKGHVCSC